MTTTPTHPSTSAVPRSRGEQVSALSGLVFAVLLVLHAALQSSDVPGITGSGSDILRYATESRDEIRLGVVLQGLAFIAFLWFVGCLWQRLRPADGAHARLTVVAAAAGAAGLALIGTHIGILAGLAFRAGDGLDAATASVLWTIAFVVLAMSSFAFAALMAALGALAFGMELPRWLAVTALASAVLWVLAGVGGASDADIWGVFGFLAFLAWLAWTAAASIVLARRPA